jgi:hypothetical protein
VNTHQGDLLDYMMEIQKAVDTLGRLETRIAELQALAEVQRGIVRRAGRGEHEGRKYVALVRRYRRGRLDLEAVREKLSDQFVRAHTLFRPVTSVVVSER